MPNDFYPYANNELEDKTDLEMTEMIIDKLLEKNYEVAREYALKLGLAVDNAYRVNGVLTVGMLAMMSWSLYVASILLVVDEERQAYAESQIDLGSRIRIELKNNG